jgi:hypothetical protein
VYAQKIIFSQINRLSGKEALMQSLRFSMLAAILLAAVASSVFAQGPTACTLKQAPELMGFHFGMSPAEVKKSLADTSMFDNRISAGSTVGSRAVNISAAELKAELGEGVEGVYLTFVDNKLTHIKVTYNGAGQWDGLQDFFARESSKLGLPKPSGADSLQGSGGNEKYTVKCEGFSAVLAYAFGVSPSIAVSDTAARTLVDKRRDKEETGVRQTRVRSLPRPGPQPNPLPPQTGEPHPTDPNSRPPN